ncbi:DNA-3-methyladenine glycosylase [Spiroplasma platyhelix]|uniref:Putative 3-methyladenine DNA glycosylase n=1 Tax=Spiroplasma platyhelix PALS-1 TaxID=1276218 RepID=A0A846TQY9_9MOLU|nr:DNA-3-methyladenine glycosylase [Spiroplasma platyhelix]MBE4704388.1 putative 3-methyladenine DNA glycosylase [Spiroplasma platyhelix PALS-1]NKE38760.1 DNA-3-methyladenine glycosylase [Spiroplasma platyhelix PALS-1]UJB28971.1 DNA-3-methyladenine glycosylase [Spiroplasma platyhelix PALS-1]
MEQIISQDFFLSEATVVAKNLLGKILVRTIKGQKIKARIVETEAYMGGFDRASHSYGFKKTPKTLPLYQEGGRIYIYLIYGMYYCFNIVVNTKDNPQAVLIRAVEIIEGHEVAINYLAGNNHKKRSHHWTNGPGKLALALNLDQSLNNLHLLSNDCLTLVSDDFFVGPDEIVAAKRVNIDYAQEDKEHFWRFYLKNNLFVSKVIK